jgi:small-conductance mechanosensitive channel
VDDLVAVVSLLHPVALARPTRKTLRRRRDVLPALRTRLLAAVPSGEITPVRLERIQVRTLLTLVAAVAAVYLLAGELQRASLRSVLREADWRWGIAALAVSAVTYVGATEALIGFVPGRLSFRLTLLAQLASSFVTLVTLCVPRIASTALTSRVARPALPRDDHRSCACGWCSS